MNCNVGQIDSPANPAASLNVALQRDARSKLKPLEVAQLTPLRPRPQTSSMPSPLTSTNLRVAQCALSGERSKTPLSLNSEAYPKSTALPNATPLDSWQ